MPLNIGSRPARGGRNRGAFQPNTDYSAGDIVFQGGAPYYANTDFVSSSVFDVTDWSTFPTGTGFITAGARGVANGVASLDASGKVPNTQLPTGAANDSQTQTFSRDGTLTLGAGTKRFYPQTGGTIQGVAAAVATAPDGTAIIVDVNKNGTTIFTAQGDRPAIAPGANFSGVKVPSVTSFVVGDYFTIDRDQIGSQPSGSSSVPTFKSDTQETTQLNVSTYDVTRPTGVVSGDIDMVTLVLGTNVTVTPPGGAGWVALGNAATTSPVVYRFARVVDGAAGPWTFTLSGTAASVYARHVVYSGADPVSITGTPVFVTEAFGNGVGPFTPTALTTPVANAVIVYQVDLGNNRGASTPSGYTPRTAFNGTAGTAQRNHLADITQATAGVSDQASFTANSATLARVSRTVLRPLVVAAPDVWTPGADLTVSMRYLEA